MTHDKPVPFDQRTTATPIGDTYERAAIPGMEVCDFCLSTLVEWKYPAGEVDLGHALSDDEWAACSACHELIELGAADGLLNRAMTGMRQRGDITDRQIMEHTSATETSIQQFMDSRGEARRITPEGTTR